MKLITEEWVDKAEGDFATAQREIQVKNSNISITTGKEWKFIHVYV